MGRDGGVDKLHAQHAILNGGKYVGQRVGRNTIPAGENGVDNAVQLGEFESSKTLPKHWADQLPLYGNLPYAAPTLTHEQIASYFKDATFGVKEGDVASTSSPRSDVRSIARSIGMRTTPAGRSTQP